MSLIYPFCAIMPAPDKAAHVVSRDLRSYAPEELQAILAYNPYSFLHIINPGFRFEQDVSGTDRNGLVRNRYLEFLQEGVFIKQETTALYLYQVETETYSAMGFVGNLHVSKYKDGRVKPHEKTLKPRVELFKEYLSTVRIQTDPVLLVHDNHPGLTDLMENISQKKPLLNFTTPDKTHHRLWQITSAKRIAHINDLMKEVKNMYIADGHHRMASSVKLYNAEKENEKAALVMSVYVPSSQLKISGFSRLVRDLNGLNKAEFLMALDRFFIVDKGQKQHLEPSDSCEFTMYLEGHYYRLTLRNEYLKNDPLKDLPPSILQRAVLKPVLGIKSMRKSKRITYDHSVNPELRMKDLVDKGLYSVGFSHYPVSYEQLKEVAERGLKMPPKSTYIEPKLKSALTLYEF